MNNLIKNLLKLQTIEIDKKSDASAAEIAKLRATVPAQILGHYDRFVSRGKRGVAIVRNQVCTACHVQVPRSMVLTLMRDEDIQICGNCGRYLYLLEEAAIPTVIPLPVVKKPRKRAAALQPV
ncbi:MAG TPA: C4-type zinc ribbon domain-containing protein [Candidatus Sulfotelmatobacter sp.]|jgi:predicted  nucleic acid-binding Zn-ribbon protein|nr:C4-type zinc ribbon domain-containing protein [Candidatus Sulfotelmatobacter sp.]